MRFNYFLLSRILKEKRKEKGLSKNKLAQYVGISQTEVTRIENGIRTVPNLLSLIYLCEVLELDFVKLLKATGFVDKQNLIMKVEIGMKKYKVSAKKDKELEFIVYAGSGENAIEIVQDVLDEVDLFDKKINPSINEFIEIEAVETEENEEEIEEKSDKSMCETCEHFCSKRSRCILEH